MNIIDIIIILLLILSAITGMKKGVLKEAVVLIGTIVVYIISFLLKSNVGILLCKLLPFFSFDGLPTLNILIYQVIAFVMIAGILFSIFTIVVKLTGIVQKLVDMTIILTLPSKILGFVIGLIEGYIIIFVILTIASVPCHNVSIFQESGLNQSIINNSPILTNTLGSIPKTINDIYKVSKEVGEDNDSEKNQINLDIMRLELDYNIVSKEEALSIIDTKKLDDVSGIKKFVNNYKKD